MVWSSSRHRLPVWPLYGHSPAQPFSTSATKGRIFPQVAIALLLACIGIYGVLSYSVAQRTAEIGIRMAIGAPRIRVISLVLADGFVSVLLGLAVGSCSRSC